MLKLATTVVSLFCGVTSELMEEARYAVEDSCHDIPISDESQGYSRSQVTPTTFNVHADAADM
jgi:hypothetical protein